MMPEAARKDRYISNDAFGKCQLSKASRPTDLTILR
jgi:hypothetical protein